MNCVCGSYSQESISHNKIHCTMYQTHLQPTIKSIVTSAAEQQFVEVVGEQKCNATSRSNLFQLTVKFNNETVNSCL